MRQGGAKTFPALLFSELENLAEKSRTFCMGTPSV